MRAISRAQREASLLPPDYTPTRQDYMALLHRLHQTQGCLVRCRATNRRLRARAHIPPTEDVI